MPYPIKSIGDIAKELFAGGDLPKDKRFSKEETEEYNIPIYANAVKEDGLYGFTHTARVLEPSITISARGTIGFTKLRTKPYYPIVRLLVLIPKEDIADLKFLEYVINTLNLRQFGSSIPQLSVPQLKNFKIPLPPLPTQKAIVEKLDTAFEKIDASIELAQKNLENIEELGKSVLEEVFGESEYNTQKLKDIITLIMGQSPKSETYNREGTGLPFFQGKKEFGEKFPTPEVYCSAPIRIAQKGDILMSVRAPVGPTNIANTECCIGRGLCAIRANIKIIEQDYLLHYLKKIEIEIASLGKGSTFSSITKSDLENLKIPLPPLEKQKEIVEHLDTVFAINKELKEKYEAKIASLKELKQSLLREAFEGRLVKE